MKRTLAMLLALLILTPATGAQAADNKQRDAAIAGVSAWARERWKEAIAFISRAHGRAKGHLAKAEKKLEKARSGREKVQAEVERLEKEIAEADKEAAQAAARRVALEKRIPLLRSWLKLIQDEDGRLKRAIDKGVLAQIPVRMNRIAAKAEARAVSRGKEAAAQIASRITSTTSAAVAGDVTADPALLAGIAFAEARRLADKSLRKAVKLFEKALRAGAKDRKKFLKPARKARKALAEALPSASAIARAVRTRLSGEATRLTEAVLAATWRQRLWRNETAELPRSAEGLAKAAGAARGTERALTAAPPSSKDIRGAVSLAPHQSKIEDAAKAARKVLERHRAAWLRALDGLSLVAQEVWE